MGDDFVPGEEFDYTAQDRAVDAANPIKAPTDIDADESFDIDFLGSRSVEDIEKESFRAIPPGHHTLRVKAVQWADNGELMPIKVYKALPDGTAEALIFRSRRVKVIFCLPKDENMTVQDIFMMPPPLRSELVAYEDCFKDEEAAKKNNPRDKGFWAKKLKQFIGRLGFVSDSQGRLPKEAGRPANWLVYPDDKPRFVGGEVQLGRPTKPKPDPQNPDVMLPSRVFNQVKMFSYTYVPSSPATTPQPLAQKPAQVPANGAASEPEHSKVAAAKGGKKK